MYKKNLILIPILLLSAILYAQDCDCQKNYEWLKNTIEQNDAGFEYALQEKGTEFYEEHNKRISEKVRNADNLSKCSEILKEWLTFFRMGHLGIKLNAKSPPQEKSKIDFSNWETFSIETEVFKEYLDNIMNPKYEGIWVTGPYRIGIKKEKDGYIGFIIESDIEAWSKGEVKLKFKITEDKNEAVFYMRDHSSANSDEVYLIGNNHLQIGRFTLSRSYPELEDLPKFDRYLNSRNAEEPYLIGLNKSTLYFRIPSFQWSEKKLIDSVIDANEDEILTTENLIIDIRNGTGGSDSSYEEILPFLYTNPIRKVGVEYLSTELNNQRMLDFIHKPEYGFDNEGKKWAQKSFERLEKERGQFVNLDDSISSITKYDTIYPYPKHVGIIINKRNGSTDEQFLLAAKQSRKVKLFGTTTMGVLDISNMYFIPSPCNDFELGYSLTRSMRIPDFAIDGIGIQPDFYFDRSIPEYEWTERVNEILNEK
jgi:hypothetical protein